MDTRRWGDPKSGRAFEIFFLVCFFLCHATAEEYSPLLENQDLSESASDSRNKFESFTHLLPFNSEQDAGYKRSSAFFPLRGKKLSAADLEAIHYPFMPQQGDSEDKRSQFYPLRGKKIPDELKRGSYFMPMRGRKDDETWSEDDFLNDDLDKRMSSFMPMRGKKKSGFLETFTHLGKPGTYPTDIMYPSSSDSNRKKRDSVSRSESEESSSVENETSPEAGSHSVQKRSVSFVPMRGRRSSFNSQEIKTRLLEKKQFSFMPMRGRRYFYGNENDTLSFGQKSEEKLTTSSPETQSTLGHFQSEDDIEKRASSFMPMRGRRPYYDDMDAFMEYDTEVKRPSNFMPMRGRRKLMGDTASAEDPETAAEDKRSSSFMPMRGRRESMDDFRNLVAQDIGPDGKRASSFMPMRGRREMMEYLSNVNNHEGLEDKRASYFMPMRGRRSEDDPALQNEIDTSKEKRPSFMPMRGRRTNEADSSLEDFLDKRSSSFMPMRGRRNPEGNETQSLEDKRGSYFMPMRGRRGLFDTTYFFKPYPFVIPSGMASSPMRRNYNGKIYPVSSVRRFVLKDRKFDWDSVKRAFHATRGKRVLPQSDPTEYQEDSEENEQNQTTKSGHGKGCRYKRSIVMPRIAGKPHKQYIALKRPMSFFATRGKRLDDSTIDSVSKLR
ncbi:uncharacterized protein NPIL_222401 [Nephila pilipes]|uniref:Uncharacterized protein n=1 Tax=Nephila pilipes TaxID=299642 RepID=A0A8X6Q9I0_NEPPI|nr:uncharacterized protein NPIL_222401 [Nephila pilipes]